MMFIDTHCHLDFPEFDFDRKEVIQRAKECGVDYIINIGSSLEGSRRSLELALQYVNIFASVGYHPHEADKVDQSLLSQLEILSHKEKVVAIGETGLDYFKNYSPRESQISLFEFSLDLAKKRKLPVIVHSRQAQKDTLEILKKFQPLKCLLHCFSADEDFLKKCLDLGFLVSFTCNITYKKAENLRQLVKLTPLESLLLETDAPFLPPEGMRGKRNEPAQVVTLAERIAKLKGIDVSLISETTTHNAKIFFNLP